MPEGLVDGVSFASLFGVRGWTVDKQNSVLPSLCQQDSSARLVQFFID
jgi:hypothetical protein